LGPEWLDGRFSKGEFSRRQCQYSWWLAGQIYTPQVVVNGKTEFVGSDDLAAHKAIEEALIKPAATKLKVNGIPSRVDLMINYEIEGNVEDAQLMIAVIQKHAVSYVKGGENKGKTLFHPQIVRDFRTLLLRITKVRNMSNFRLDSIQRNGKLLAFCKTVAPDLSQLREG
jgi:hypothetical protein